MTILPPFRFSTAILSPLHHVRYNVALHKNSSAFSTSASNSGVAVVTGASRGIGRAVALRLAQDGYDVSVNDLPSNVEGLKDVECSIVGLGRKSSVSVGDVSKEEDVKALVKSAVDDLGGVDVMVANAGICGLTSIVDMPVEEMDRHYAVNIRGVFLSYQYAAQQMIKQGRGGRIIGASSIAGKQGQQHFTAYVASKFAVRGLTQNAALELGKYGITVNAYAPGAIDTDMTKMFQGILGEKAPNFALNPVGRMGKVEDVASLVSFLASSKSGFITGQSVSYHGSSARK
ncbi:NAD-binding protein [Cyathus striatus]|nr:NAD-binding protein [Cyathus striatus]